MSCQNVLQLSKHQGILVKEIKSLSYMSQLTLFALSVLALAFSNNCTISS